MGSASPNNTIAVIIPTHNRPLQLRRALESLFTQTTPPDEIVVVDDGSSPPVNDAIFERAPLATRCILIGHAHAMGANAARNRGIGAAEADYVAFLDDDDEFMSEKVAVLKSAIADHHPDVLHHTAVIEYDNEHVSYCTRVSQSVSFPALLTANLVGGTSVGCVKRAFLQSIGSFDAQLPALQDWDLWLRAAQVGGQFLGLETVLTRYHFVTGEPAISKSIDNLAKALAIIDHKYQSEMAALQPHERRQRARTDSSRYGHRHAMNNRRMAASMAYLKGAFSGRSAALASAAVLSVLGIGCLARARRHFAGKAASPRDQAQI